jgi:hypothetical protein
MRMRAPSGSRTNGWPQQGPGMKAASSLFNSLPAS